MSDLAKRGQTGAPFIFAPRSQRAMTWGTCLALLPALAWGLVSYGLRALALVVAAVAAAAVAEAAAGLVSRRPFLADGSIVLTGLIIGMSMPPSAPFLAPVIASVFAALVVKWPAGGLGANWMNPAMGGLAFAQACFGESLRNYRLPASLGGPEVLSGATPLQGLALAGGKAAAYAGTGFDSDATNFLNDLLLRRLGAPLPGGYMDLLFGNRPGTIGEASIILLMFGSILLLATRTIRWEIPVSTLAVLAGLSWIFGTGAAWPGLFCGDALLALFGGSAFLGAMFCATDPVTSPTRPLARAAYGTLVGILIFLFRKASYAGDGTAFAIIIANAAVPLLDRRPGPWAKAVRT